MLSMEELVVVVLKRSRFRDRGLKLGFWLRFGKELRCGREIEGCRYVYI